MILDGQDGRVRGVVLRVAGKGHQATSLYSLLYPLEVSLALRKTTTPPVIERLTRRLTKLQVHQTLLKMSRVMLVLSNAQGVLQLRKPGTDSWLKFSATLILITSVVNGGSVSGTELMYEQ